MLAVLATAACSALTVPDAPPASTPLAPIWDQGEMREHLTFLQSEAVRGRADASLGYGIAAAYAADRLREYGLQPVLGRDFRVIHTNPRNVVSGARLRYAGSDTLDFRVGVDFLPDGRSDAFDGVLSSLWLHDVDGAAADSGSTLLWVGDMDADVEARILQSEIGVLALQRALLPVPSADRWEGKSVVQFTPRTARRILTNTRRDETRPTHRILDRPLEFAVSASWSRLAPGINVVGYLPGKNPEWSDEAVMLCTHLDAVGTFSGVRVLDLKNFGVEVSAVLETTRQLGRFSRFSRIPERTLIVAFLSGGTVDASGFEDLLSSPFWTTDQIKAVIYVGNPRASLASASPASVSTVRVENIRAEPAGALPDTLFLLPNTTSEQPGRARAPTAGDYMGAATASAEALAGRLYVYVTSKLMSSSADAVSE
jgi:hypothetical protein